MPFKFPKFFLTFAVAIVLATSGAAFAGGAHKSSGSQGHAENRGHADGMKFGEPGKPSEVNRTIEIKMGDNYFKPEEIVVRAGETIRFAIKNEGEFLHEFNIGTAAMHAEHQKEMMTMMEKGMLTATGVDRGMKNMGHGKTGMSGDVHDDPNSTLIEPGKTKELVWKFAAASNLEFACNVPGHYEAGMMGKFEFGAKHRPVSGS